VPAKGLISCRGGDKEEILSRKGFVRNGQKIFAWWIIQAKIFILKTKGGENPLAFRKDQKEKMMDQYRDWYKQSQAVILVEYSGLDMKGIGAARAKAREAGGELHVVKNTLMVKIMEEAGIKGSEKLLDKSSAIGFAFNDAAAMAKAMSEFGRGNDFFKVKGGFLGVEKLSAADVKSLAELPPLPVMRAKLLGTIQAPAGKLVRMLAEPGRQVASVLKAYSDKGVSAAA
jgi:large subunit ribosomal protein L10